MSTGWKIWGRGFVAVSVVLFCTACGGGGGSSGKTDSLVDPASAYTGITTRATVSPENAEKLAMDGADIIDITSNLTFRSSDEKGGDTAKTDDRTARQLAQVVKQSLRRMDLPGKIAERQQVKSASALANAARVESTQVPGEGGGYVSYTYDINDATGSVSGVIDYYGYTSGGITLSGSAEMSGTLDANRQEFSRFTLSFKSLTMGDGVDSIKVVGSLSWGFTSTLSTETLTINMVVIDNADNRTYWSRDYEISDTFRNGILTKALSGRYYDPDDGYVDFTTLTPLLYDGNGWPVQGSLLFAGGQGTWVRLTFFLDHLLLEVDADGNGVAEWQKERTTNLQPPSNSLPTNTPPVAAAGLDQSVTQWSTVLLDGSSSYDANGDPLTYSWAFESCPQYTCPGLTGANTATPSFRAERTGTYLLRLTVYDGQSSSPADTVSVIATPVSPSEPNLLQKQWQYGLYSTSQHLDGPLSAVAVGDVDDDGEDEIVMVTFRSDGGYEEGIIHIFNARTHVLEFQEKLGIQDWMGVRSVKIGDVDGDGKTEFVVTTGNLYDGVIRVYDGASHTLKKESAGYNGNFFTALAIGDVDNDGKMEIVAGQGRAHTGAAGVYLIVFDGTTLQEKWRSADQGNYWGGIYDVKLDDVDKDGHPDIVATVDGSRLVVFDGVNHNQKLLVEHPARAVEVADVDGDGTREILVGREDGKIDLFNGATFALTKTVFAFSSASVDALRVADLDGNGTQEWLVSSGGFLTVLEGEGQGLKWRSSNLTENLGRHNHLVVKDSDGDGRQEIFLGSDLALYHFK